MPQDSQLVSGRSRIQAQRFTSGDPALCLKTRRCLAAVLDEGKIRYEGAGWKLGHRAVATPQNRVGCPVTRWTRFCSHRNKEGFAVRRPGFRAHHGVRADRSPQTEPLPELRMGPHPDFPVDGLQVAESLDEESVHSPGGAHQLPGNPLVSTLAALSHSLSSGSPP